MYAPLNPWGARTPLAVATAIVDERYTSVPDMSV